MIMHRSLPTVQHRKHRTMLAGAILLGALVASSGAHAQAAYDTSLRSIGPATINQANFDVHARSPVQSIGANTVENRSPMVPAFYDPSLGRFVSALGNARGAILLNTSSTFAVTITNQSGVFAIGNVSNSTPQRSEALALPTVSTQVTATALANGR
jgi:hypothetical protein